MRMTLQSARIVILMFLKNIDFTNLKSISENINKIKSLASKQELLF
jgi:hypothetical protein